MAKRGQSALEYLVTYGWAILAIVIIAAVLWYFGIFNPARFAGEKQCGGFSAFICQDFLVNTTGGLTIVLNNKAGGTLSAVGATGGSCSPATNIGPNQNTTCTIPGFNAGGTSGETYEQATLSLAYTDQRSGIAHTDSGFVRGKYE